MKTFRIHSLLGVWAVVAVILVIPSCSSRSRLTTEDRISRFENSLERLQRDLKIPGMAAVILEGQQVRWAKGFGYADVEKGIEATPHTPFQLCSVTKPVAAMIIHRLVEQGKLDLQTPLIDYGIDLDSEGTVRLIHLITHTSQGIPGTQYRYHGDRYGMLGTALKRETGKSFRTLFVEEVLEPLEMIDSAPNPADPELLERFFEYRRANGLGQSIRDADGNEWASSDLFDYDDPLWESSIYLAAAMLADYFDSVGIKKDRFLRYVDKTTDGRTKRDFAEFYTSTNEYLSIYERLATPYGRDSEGNMVPDKYSMFFNCAAGLNASVLDIAKFDIALDTDHIVTPPVRENDYRAFVTTD